MLKLIHLKRTSKDLGNKTRLDFKTAIDTIAPSYVLNKTEHLVWKKLLPSFNQV